MTVAEDDAKLAKLKLPLNDTCQEGDQLTAEEERYLAAEVVAKLRVRRRTR